MLKIRQHVREKVCFGAIIFSMAMLSSCNTINEPEGNCPNSYKVGFTHTINLAEEDMFGPQVKSLYLYIFDTEGRLVKYREETTEELLVNNYEMDVDVPAGVYDLVAWGGLMQGDAFNLTHPDEITTKEELLCRLNRVYDQKGIAISDKKLNDIFHGYENQVVFPADNPLSKVATVDMTKNTNMLRVVLHHYNGRVLDKDLFSCTITDNNGLMNYENRVLDDEHITYKEWSKKDAVIANPDKSRAEDDDNDISAVVAEINVARLISNHNPILRIFVEGDANPIIQMPLIDLLLIAKGDGKSELSDQDYLDRQDDFNLYFSIDDSYGWYKKDGVFVNGWKLVFQDSDL